MTVGGGKHIENIERPFSKEEVPAKERPSRIFIQPKKPDFVLDLGGESVSDNPEDVVIDMAGTEVGRNPASDFSLQLGGEKLEQDIPEVVIDLVGAKDNPLWEFRVVPEEVSTEKTANSDPFGYELESLVAEIEELKGRLLEKDPPMVTSTLEQSVYENDMKYSQPKVTSTLEQYGADGPLVVSTLEQQLYEGAERPSTEGEMKFEIPGWSEQQPHFGRSPVKELTAGQQQAQKPSIESTLEQAFYQELLSDEQGKKFTYGVIPGSMSNEQGAQNEVLFTSTLEQHQKSSQFNSQNGLLVKIEDNPVKIPRVENPSTIYGVNEVDLVNDLPQRAEVLDSYGGGRLLQTSGLTSLTNFFTEDPLGAQASLYDLENTSEDLVVSLVDGEETHPWYQVVDDQPIPVQEEDNTQVGGVKVMKEGIQILKEEMEVLAKDVKDEGAREKENSRPLPASVDIPAPVEVVGDAGYLVKYQYGQQSPSTGDLLEAPADAKLQEKSKNSQLPVRFPQQETAVQRKKQQNFGITNGRHSQFSTPKLNLGEERTSNIPPGVKDKLVQKTEKDSGRHYTYTVQQYFDTPYQSTSYSLSNKKNSNQEINSQNVLGVKDTPSGGLHLPKGRDAGKESSVRKSPIHSSNPKTFKGNTVQQYFETPFQSTSYYLSNKRPSNPENNSKNAHDVMDTSLRGPNPTEVLEAVKESSVGNSPILSSIPKTFSGETYVARSHGETRPREGIAPAVTNGGGIAANKLTSSGIWDLTGGRNNSPVQIISKVKFPSNNFDKEVSTPKVPSSKMPILAGGGVLKPESKKTDTLEYKWRQKDTLEYKWRQKDQPNQERPETDYYPPTEEATSQERPDTGHSGLYAYEDWMAQAVRSMENYLNSEDKASGIEERDEDNEKILYKMVDGVYQRTLLRKDDAEVKIDQIFLFYSCT